MSVHLLYNNPAVQGTDIFVQSITSNAFIGLSGGSDDSIFIATNSSGSAISATGTIPFANVIINRGGDYDGTGTYTAPVTGYYAFTSNFPYSINNGTGIFFRHLLGAATVLNQFPSSGLTAGAIAFVGSGISGASVGATGFWANASFTSYDYLTAGSTVTTNLSFQGTGSIIIPIGGSFMGMLVKALG